MIVTGIEAATKKKYKVELDGQLAFVLYKSELSRYGIKTGEILSDESYHEIISQILTKRAKHYLMHLLVKTDKTEHELQEKLKKGGYPPEAAEAALAYVKSYGYVDDERYARNYIETQSKKASKKQIKWKLSAKGIPKEVVDQLWEQAEKPDESEVLNKMIDKKIRDKTKLNDRELKSLVGYLYRKGFQIAAIWEAVGKYRVDNREYSDFG